MSKEDLRALEWSYSYAVSMGCFELAEMLGNILDREYGFPEVD